MNLTSHRDAAEKSGQARRRILTSLPRLRLGQGSLWPALNDYVELAGRYGSHPTFVAAAERVDRHPGIFQELHNSGAELAIHGGEFSEHKRTSIDIYRKSLERAVSTFQKHRIPFSGLRTTNRAGPSGDDLSLSDLGFRYTSSRALAWEVMDREQFTARSLNAYQQLLESQRIRKAVEVLSLPRPLDGLPDLPIAMPDGEIMVDMLRLSTGSIASVWLRTLQRIHRLGELMVVSLRPERLRGCVEAIERLLVQAKQYSPGVWLATAAEVAEWWEERQKTKLLVRYLGQTQYEVAASGSERATVLIRQMADQSQLEPWDQQYRRVPRRGTVVESAVRPCIGLHPEVPSWLGPALLEAGFLAEEAVDRAAYALYFDRGTSFENPRALFAAIEGSDAPLVRLGLWPYGKACALSITGDVLSKGIVRGLRGILTKT